MNGPLDYCDLQHSKRAARNQRRIFTDHFNGPDRAIGPACVFVCVFGQQRSDVWHAFSS